MKKLLILAYDFPPYVSVGGLRPYSWYRYLKEFGVEPTLVTRQWENKYGNELDYISPSASKETIIEETEYGTIIKAPFFPSLANRLLLKHGKKKYKFLRKALTAIDEIRQYLYILTPKKQVYYSAKKYLKNNKVDAIIATGEPFVMFFYAKKLSQKYNIPWIADYRDPWSQNKARRINKFLIRINTYFETKISNTANCITTVSVFLKKTIEENVFDKTFHIIPNGYNPELIDETAKKTQSSKKLTISFIGTIYKWHPWQSFLNVFTKLATNNHNIKIDFYGINNVDEVKSYIASLPEKVQNQIKIYPKLQNKELMQKNANANVFLLFNDYSILGTKIYDYLGLKRKILLCYTNDQKALDLKKLHYTVKEIEGVSKTLQADIIKETNSGIIVKNRSHLITVLLDLVQEFNEKGFIECNSQNTEQYSRKIQTQKLAEIIKSI